MCWEKFWKSGEQDSFWSGCSCINCIFFVYQFIDKHLAHNLETYLMFINLHTLMTRFHWPALECIEIKLFTFELWKPLQNLHKGITNAMKVEVKLSEESDNKVTKGLKRTAALPPLSLRFTFDVPKLWAKCCYMGVPMERVYCILCTS